MSVIYDSLTNHSPLDGTNTAITGAAVDANPNVIAQILDGTTATDLATSGIVDARFTSSRAGLRLITTDNAAGSIYRGLTVEWDPGDGGNMTDNSSGIGINFKMPDSVDNQDVYAAIDVLCLDDDTTTEDGELSFKLVKAGTLTEIATLASTTGLTVGVDDTGYDVKFFGATSGQFMLWDESADELVLAGDSKLSFHDAAGGENIIASSDGHLEVNAGTTLDITAPTVDLNSSTKFNIDTAAYDLNASGAVTIDSAGVSIDSSAASNLTTSGGALTITSAAAATWSTAAGALTINGTGGVNVQEGGATIIGISDSRVLSTSNTASIDMDATGAVQINSSGGAISVANDNVDQTVNLATAGTRTLNIGILDGTDTTTITSKGNQTHSGTITVGVDNTGYDVKFFGDTSGSSLLWDESADDLIFTNAGIAVGSDATGDVYYRNASGFLARLAVGSDADVLTLASGIPSWATPTTGDITGVTAGNGLSGGGTSGGVTLALDLSELTDTAIANGDYIVFTDATDSAATVKGDLADVATLFAGTGLTASSSVIGVDASQTQITAVGTIATGTWQGTKVASAYLDDDTAHLSGSTFTAGIEIDVASGDPTIIFDTQGADKYILGVDDSDSDYLKISVGGTLGANVGEYGFYDGYGFSVVAPEANEARLYLAADNADDVGDVWRLVANASGGFEIEARTSGTSAMPANSDTWTQRMGIDSDGDVGIGIAAPDGTLHVHTASAGSITPSTGADDLIIESSGNTGMSLLSPAANEIGIYYGDPDNAAAGRMIYNHATPDWSLWVEGSERQTTTSTYTVMQGLAFVSDSANGNMSQGLTINQSAYDTEILAFKSSDVAGGALDGLETDTFGAFAKVSATGGGVVLRGKTDSDAGSVPAVWTIAYTDDSFTDATHGATGRCMREDWMVDHNGSGGYVTPSTGQNLSGIRVWNGSAWTTRWLVSYEGNIYAEGTLTTYDDHDDVALLSAFDAAQDPSIMKGAMQAEWEDFEKYNEQTLIDLDILGGPRHGVPEEERGLINYTGLSRLTVGAVRQLGREHAQMKADFSEAIDQRDTKIALLEQRLNRLEN